MLLIIHYDVDCVQFSLYCVKIYCALFCVHFYLYCA
jgi:hypothetical protein